MTFDGVSRTQVGSRAVVRAGAAVVADVDAGTVVAGAPARPLADARADDDVEDVAAVVDAACAAMGAWRRERARGWAPGGFLRPDDGRAFVMVCAGGHCATLVGELRDQGREPSAVYDDDARRHGGRVLGVPVAGPVADAPADAAWVLALGQNEARRALVARHPGAAWATVVHPTARVHATATVGRGVNVEPCAVVGAGARLGDFTLVGARAVVGEGAAVGDYAFVGGASVVGAGATVGDGAVVGMGAALLPGASLGAAATVAVGSLVRGAVPAGAAAAGVTAAALGAIARTRLD